MTCRLGWHVNRRRMLPPYGRTILPRFCQDDAGRARGRLESARDRPGVGFGVMLCS